jgi:hypothetical protein
MANKTHFLPRGVSRVGPWQISKPLQLRWRNFNPSNELCVVRIFNLKGVSTSPSSSRRLFFGGLSCLGLEGFQPHQGSFNPSSSLRLFFCSPSCLGQVWKDFNFLRCVFITAGPIIKLCAGGVGGQ